MLHKSPISPAPKYRIQTPPKGGQYRLTLTAEAFALAVAKSKPISGFMALPRIDGKWDVMVSPAVADTLNQQRQEGEHLTDVVVRILGGRVMPRLPAPLAADYVRARYIAPLRLAVELTLAAASLTLISAIILGVI